MTIQLPTAKTAPSLAPDRAKVLLYGPAKIGKALACDTPIPTPTGWTTMGAITDGDVVFDERGEPCSVIAAGPIYLNRPCYRVIFDDGAEIVADAEHLWATTVSRTRTLVAAGNVATTNHQVSSTEDIARTLSAKHAIENALPLDLSTADLPIDPYVLGVWLGDGATDGGRVSVPDEYIWNRIQDAGYDLGSHPPSATCRNHTVLGLQVQLRALGVLGNKHIPATYLRASIEQRSALLAGLLDTDGYAAPTGAIEFTNTCETLAEDVCTLLHTLGLKHSVTEGIATLGGRQIGRKWRISFRTRRPVFSLPRKLERQAVTRSRTGSSRSGSMERRYIRRVVECESLPVRCIEVDSASSLYLASKQMIPTHNSTLASEIDPDHTLFLATEPGLGAIEAYTVPVTSWREFREVGVELAKGEHDYRIVVVDTVDELIRMCSDDVLTKLGASHASDLAYGKGWAAIADEFRLRIARLSNLGLGVWFISHSKETEIKTAVGSVTKHVPDIGGQARSFLIGFCDLILFAGSQLTQDGERRILRTSASENWEAGGRVPLPDPLPLDADALKRALGAACAALAPAEPEPQPADPADADKRQGVLA